MLMFCKKCGNQCEENAKFCNQCGQSLESPITAKVPAQEVITIPVELETSQKATWSMIIGLLSLICCCLGMISGAIAIILGILAKQDIQQNPERLTGESQANAGIIFGAISIFFNLLIPILNIIFKPEIFQEAIKLLDR